MYLYQNSEWPNFTWNQEKIFQLLSETKLRQGKLIGRMEGLGFSLQSEAMLQTMTLEIIKSNEIEGEVLDADQVRSSIARRLGMDIAGLVPTDRNVDGVVEMMMDATQNFQKPLTAERLFGWHAALFPTGRSGMHKIVVGTWRTNTSADPMQVVSGAIGKESVHFEAPEGKALPGEMKKFLDWFNSNENIDPLLKSAVAHLWFVTVHPFDDGNGRIARTITDMLLARADGISQRFYSMSAQIRLERKSYYDILERTQKGSLDITDWLIWFLICLDKTLKAAGENLSGVLRKSKYWEWLRAKNLNERQKLMINKLLDGFEGKLNTSKWAKISKCSHDTALRDITNLMEQGVLVKEPGGSKNTSYNLIDIS
jgi:Fic family protein